jgi:predicted  nucleic acid-binding Zn-ribbon protein
MNSEFHNLRDAVERAQTNLKHAERNLADLQARSATIAAEHDAASQTLAAARNARAANPGQPHLTTAVNSARDHLEAVVDASEGILRDLETATASVADAKRALATAEAAFAPAKAAHNDEARAAHEAQRKTYDSALPAARKLIALFGPDATRAFAAIVAAGCENPIAPFVERTSTSIFEQIAAQAAR